MIHDMMIYIHIYIIYVYHSLENRKRLKSERGDFFFQFRKKVNEITLNGA